MTTELSGFQSAKRIIQWMDLGVLPSQENALKARATLAEVDPAAVTQSRVVLGAIEMGFAPRRDLCRSAIAEIDAVIDIEREVSSAQLREHFERG